jgi:hypothetical protein
MTDDPNYAASYVKNGGTVAKVTIPRSTLNQMYYDGNLNYYNGLHLNNTPHIEYQFSPQIKHQIIMQFKY